MPSLSARDYVQAKRAGRATSVRVAPTGTAVEQYQVPLGNRHSLKEAGVIGLPSWSEKATQTETWVKVPRLSATCPRRVVAFDGGKGNIDRCMEFGDEFNGSSLDAAKWTSAGGGTPTVSGGALTITAGSGTYLELYTVPDVSGQIVGCQFTSTAAGGDQVSITAGGYCGVGRHQETGNIDFVDTKAAWLTALHALAIGTAVKYEIQYAANTIRARKNRDTSTWTTQARTPTVATNNKATLLVSHTVGRFDFAYVRKYTASEPLAGTAQPTATNRALSRPLNHAGLIRACCTA